MLDYLDPDKKYISHRLYRQHCTLEKGYFLKDLRVINRKPEDVVLVDNSPYCHILQPENAIPIVPFYHFPKDRELESLLSFLKVVVAANDTRTVIAQTYFWDRYIKEPGDPRKLFFKYYQKDINNEKWFFRLNMCFLWIWWMMVDNKKPIVGVEPTTFYLQGKCSTTKLYRLWYSSHLFVGQMLTINNLLIWITDKKIINKINSERYARLGVGSTGRLGKKGLCSYCSISILFS